MKAEYSNYDICEMVDIKGKKGFQYSVKGGRGITFLDSAGNDENMILLRNVALWPLPGDLNPPEYGSRYYFDWEDRDGVMNILVKVSKDIKELLEKHLYFKDPRYSSILTCFILNSYFLNEFDYCPRLIIAGVSGSGKSTLQTILTQLCYRGFNVVSLTPASIFRMIDPFGVTTIVDESQHMGMELKSAFDQLYKVGDNKNCPLIIRNASMGNGYLPDGFRTYGSMAISIKPGTFEKEDIENRSFRITMERCSEPRPKTDNDVMKEIRTCLYRLRFQLIRHPDILTLKDNYDTMYEWMDKIEVTPEECSFALKKYPMLYELKGLHGKLSGRTRDIMGVYGTLSYLFGGFDDIISMIFEMNDQYREKDRDTQEGRIFIALLDLAEGYPLNQLNSIYCISTRDIKERLLLMTEDAGNSSRFDTNITANKVTHTLKDLGFKVGPGTGNKSFIKPDPSIKNTFLRCTKMYCTDEQVFHYTERLDELTPIVNKRSFGKSSVSDKSQT